MTLIVCPLHDVAQTMARYRPARVVSLLAPNQEPPDIPEAIPRLLLRFHDISEPRQGLIAPDQTMVSDLLAFGATWRGPAPLLIHCWMGISRSTAAALVLACALDPGRDETEIALALRNASPTATPNPLIVSIADDLIGRNGRMVGALAAIGQGRQAPYGGPFQLSVRGGGR
jgi:predicted protein tyrosine phosphatase